MERKTNKKTNKTTMEIYSGDYGVYPIFYDKNGKKLSEKEQAFLEGELEDIILWEMN